MQQQNNRLIGETLLGRDGQEELHEPGKKSEFSMVDKQDKENSVYQLFPAELRASLYGMMIV